jgi:uncharacterized iron-regulated protein
VAPTDDNLVEALTQCVEKMKLIYQVVKNDRSFNQIINNQNFDGKNYNVDNQINLNLTDKGIIYYFRS